MQIFGPWKFDRKKTEALFIIKNIKTIQSEGDAKLYHRLCIQCKTF